MRIVFLGSPEFALPTLRRLAESDHDLVAVYTQPDRPSGRGRKPSPPPAKLFAMERGIAVRQPERISRPADVAAFAALAPELAVIAAYGQILKQPVLDVPPLGVLNVHASLLPRWRGAAPINAAILAGDAETGATIRCVELGPMLGSVRIPIARGDTTGSLTPRVAEAGAELLTALLPAWESGSLVPRPQDDTAATYAPQIRKGDAIIDWDACSAAEAERIVRAYNPWPVAFTTVAGAPLRIHEAVALDGSATPGSIIAAENGSPAGFCIATRDGLLGIITLQPPGGRPMPAADYLRGHRALIGARAGT
ncbi:MAG: methionyl-tRNA formyltransferase [Chloroflexi bacterium]|nr:methionyl-tRNA formyltransferase [Chloroflexota bacterium]